MLYRKPKKLILLLDRLFLCIEDVQSSWSVHFTILARILRGPRGKWTDVDELSEEMMTIIESLRTKNEIPKISYSFDSS